MPRQRFSVVPGRYAVCRLPADTAVPFWASAPGGFTSVTRTADELSIVCEEARVPAPRPESLRGEGGFALLKIHGPFPLDAVGILAGLAKPLADAGISLLAIGTFDTDYLLVKRTQAARAVVALTQSGHTLVED
jgi:uncharacterized protein